jgi:quercetin dioxygenase-like cupin family protein
MRLEAIPWNGNGLVHVDALQQQLEQEGFNVFRWRDEAGVSYEPHSHEHDESLWVVDGELIFSSGGRDFRLRAGDRLMLPRGTVHAAHAGAAGVTYLIGEK